ALENNPTEGLQRATEFFEQELAGARWRLAHAEKHLVEKTLPHYCKEEFSDEFYEYIIDVGNQFASLGGVDPLGTVSQTGLGDGGYRLMVAKEDGLVVAAYIEYLPTKEFKSSETQDSLKIS